MVLLVASLVVVIAGVLAYLVFRRWPQADPAFNASLALEEGIASRGRLRRFLRSRVNPATATGLLLTVTLAGLVATGAIVGLFAWWIRREGWIVSIDKAVERWAEEHATAFTDAVLGTLTHLGDTTTVVVVAILVSLYGLVRWRRATIPLFVALVVGGQALISNTIKLVVDRARPELRPRAEFTGTSFPSGHTTAAAATYLAVALVLAIASSPRARAALAAAAVAIGVAVGCTRVLLGVHFFSDALAGLAIGWTWFGLCAVAFGGRWLRFGAPAEVPPVRRTASPPRPRAPAPG